MSAPKEPWSVGDSGLIYNADAFETADPMGATPEERQTIGARIMACVNACAGISDNELTHGPVIPLQRYSTLANQRDEAWKERDVAETRAGTFLIQRDELAANLRNLLAAVRTCREIGKIKGGELAAEVDAIAALAKVAS